MINYLFAVALLISQITPAVESAAQKGMLPTFWQPICELSEELDTKPHKAIAALQAATKKIERMHRANLRTQIYATANVGTKEGKAARLASIYYAGKLQEGLAQLNTATAQNSVEGAAAATYLKGHLDEYLTLWAHVKQDATEACLLTTGGGGAAAVAADTLGGVQCKRRLAKPSSSSQNPEAMTQAGFPKLVKAITADAQQHSAGKCPLSSGHSANGLGDTGKVSTTFKVLDGYLSIPDSNSPVTVANLEALSNNHKTSHPAWHAAWEADNRATAADSSAFSNETGDIKNYGLISEAIRTVDLNKAEAADADVEAQLTSYFGGKDDAKWKEFIAKIEKFPITAKTGKQAEPTTLGAIEDTETLLTILYHYQLQLSKRLTELQTRLDDTESKGKNKTPEQLCNEIKDAKTCNADKKCKYDAEKKEEPKCTLSEEGKKKQ